MRRIKEVLRLKYELGLGQRQIARSCSIGQSTVHDYLRRAEAAGLRWPLTEDWDDDRIEHALFGNGQNPATPPSPRPMPEFASIHEQLRKHRHLTLQLLWVEYRQAHPGGYAYSHFCQHYQQWRRKLDVVLRQEHKAGEKLFVDWAGPTIPIYDRTSGQVWQASLFVAVLGASSYTYAEATRDQQMESWIQAHIHAFEFYGGVPSLIIPDNARTGVTRACRYDPDLNPTYQEMAMHYGVGVVPTRPYKPRDKDYVSYCTLSCWCRDEGGLLGRSATLAFENGILIKWLIETSPHIVVAVFFQQPGSAPSIDCSEGHIVPDTHLFGREQSFGSQSAVATF
jgi:transposase